MSDLGAERGQPGVVPLRPLAGVEIMQGSLATIRRQPGLLLGIAFVVVGITELISVVVTWSLGVDVPSFDPAQSTLTEQELRQVLVPLATQLGISLVIGLVAEAFLSGLSIAVIGRAVLGRSLPPGQAWRELRPRLLPLLGLTVLYTVLVALGPAIAMLLTMVFGGGGALLWFLAGTAVALWLYVRFSLAIPALVLEPASIGESLRRSALLVRGAWGRTFGILLGALVLAFLLSMLIQLPFEAGTGTDSGGSSGLATTVVLTIGAIVAGTVSRPFTAGVTALIYIDRRMRVENMQQALERAARS